MSVDELRAYEPGGVSSTAVGAEESLPLAARLRTISRASAAITATIAVVSLLGWVAHLQVLTRIVAGLPSLKANAAVALVLASFAVVAYAHSGPRCGVRYVGAVCAAVVLVVGATTLAEYAFGWRLGIDQLLFHDQPGPHVPYPGRPAANAALSFVLVGLALLFWEVRLRGVWVSHVLAWVTATLGLLALAGYATGAQALASLPSGQGIALGAALGVILLSLSILLARPERGEIALLASGGHGGLVLRRLLPVALFLLPACAGLSLAGQRLGWFSSATGAWLSAIVGTLALVAIAWAVAVASESAEQAAGRLAAVVESSEDAIISMTVAGVIVSWNAAAERTYGYSAAGAVGQHIAILSPPGRAREQAQLLARVAAGERVRHLEVVRRRRDGGLLDVSLTLSPVRDRAGRIVGMSAIARDFTEHKRAERELERLAQAAEHSSDVVISFDLERRIRHWNRGAERVFGVRAEEAIGRSVDQQLSMLAESEETSAAAKHAIGRALAGESVRLEVQRRRQDGTVIDLEITVAPWGVDGRVVGATSAGVDVSERKRAERELERLAQAAEFGADAIVSFDLEMCVRCWNLGAERLSGFTAAEVLGLSIDELNALTDEPPETGIRARAAIARILRGESGYQVEAQRRHKDGTVYDVLSTFVAWRVDGRVVGATNTTVDITERKRAERELARLAQAVEHGSDAILSFDRELRIRYWNAGAERLYGYEAAEVLGLRTFEVAALVSESPQAIAESQSAVDRALGGERVSQLEARHRHKDGTEFDALITVTPWRVGEQVIGATTTAVDISQRKRAERERERALADLEEAQRIATLGSWTWVPASGQASWSAQMYEIFGRDPADGPVTGEALLMYVHPEDRDRAADYAQMSVGACAVELDCRIIVSGAERALHVLAYADPARSDGYLGTVQDVSKTRAVERALRAAEERFRRAFEGAPTGMALLSLDWRLEQVNAALAALVGCTRQELEGELLSKLLHPADVELATEQLRALALGEHQRIAVEMRIMSAAGATVDVIMHASALRHGNDEPTRLLCQVQDITERKRFESELQFMADHDPLTGLMNRRKFEAELDRHVEHVKRYGSQSALLMLDIDNFKAVNDTLGHNAGDELIISIAGVLNQRVRASDVLARLGGDEFAVLLPRADQAEAAQVADALVRAVRENAALLGGQRQKVTTSVGIAIFDATDSALSGESALIEGDLAMYDAKDNGRNGYAFYASADHRISRTKARLTWVTRIEQALESDRFALVAQPILDLRTNRIGQHELLLRMLDEHDDMIPPAAFLYLAERFDLIAGIDRWVVAHAIELIDQHPELRLHVNISGKSLGNQQLLQTIDEHLRASRIDPGQLIFEVTETAAVANITDAQAFAQRLRDHGCRFALDDFGAGFGSFYYLKHLPFDYVKIDGEFVQNVINGRVDQLVIDAVVRIARGLGNETIAEFVTNEQTQQMVARLGVDHAQGYHIGRPIPIPDLLNHTLTNPL